MTGRGAGKRGEALATMQRSGAAVQREKAAAYAEQLRGVVEDVIAGGATTSQQIAEALNKRAVPTRRNARWHTSNVRDLLARLRRRANG
jgi:hypothetical protein